MVARAETKTPVHGQPLDPDAWLAAVSDGRSDAELKYIGDALEQAREVGAALPIAAMAAPTASAPAALSVRRIPHRKGAGATNASKPKSKGGNASHIRRAPATAAR